MFEKLDGWGREIKFLSWPSIQLGLDFPDEGWGNSREVSSFWDILPNKFVGILDQPFLPRTVWIGKINDYAIKSFGYQLMGRELAAIIRGYGQNPGQPIRIQEPDYGFGNRLGILPMRQLFDDAVWGIPLSKDQNGSVTVLADNEIHFPVAETWAVSFFGSLVDACAVWDIGGLGRFVLFFRLSVILPFVSGIGKQLAAFVSMYVIVDDLFRYVYPFFGQSADNLRRRPLHILNPLFYAP